MRVGIFVLFLIVEAFTFPLLSMMLPLGLSYMVSYVEVHFSYTCFFFFLAFYHIWMLDFCQMIFFCICRDDQFSQFSCSVVSNSLRPHGLQHAGLPCPTQTVEMIIWFLSFILLILVYRINRLVDDEPLSLE